MKINVIGSAVLDIILRPKERIVLKDRHLPLGSKIDLHDFFISLGGGALNASKSFQNLNLLYQAYFKLGNDFIGNLILRKIKEEKINSKVFLTKNQSSFSVILLAENGERTIFVYRGESLLNEKELNTIPLTDFYFITTGNLPLNAVLSFLRKIRAKAKLICLLPSKIFLENRKAFEILRLVDIIIFNDEEAEILVKRKDTPVNLGKEIFKKVRPKILVITLGEKGSLTFFEDKIIQSGVFRPKKLVDFTGAGDSFASAFFGSLILDKEINLKTVQKAILWGSANSSANIEKLGAQIGLLKRKDYKKYEKRGLKLEVFRAD